MKQITKLMLVIFLLISDHLTCQDFSFKLIFQDAIGNSDTLILGYDANATDSIDIEYDETNIISTKLDSVFDVRITNEWSRRNSNGSFNLKKQIIKTNCDSWPTPICIDIKCKNWPVTILWDSSFFNNSCRNGSVFTSIPPGGWWDIMSPSDLYRVALKFQSQVTFSANYDEYLHENYAYINNNLDTISVFWFAFANSSILEDQGFDYINKNTFENGVFLYPNPTFAKIKITNDLVSEIKHIKIFDLSGKSLGFRIESDIIDLSGLQSGIYFISIKFKDDSLITRKIVKE